MQVPGFTAFRHGPVTQTIAGEPLAYYAEYEFPDMETSRGRRPVVRRAPRRTPQSMGYAHSVYVADID